MSSHLDAAFASLAAKGEKALILFVTGGDPSLDDLPDILAALEEGGADVIEIGVPFSDPIADGPTIQASSQRALDAGVTPGSVLEALGRARGSVPKVAMGYLNTWMHAGFDSSCKRLAEAGVSGVILSDMIPEEAQAWKAAARTVGLRTILLAAPTSTDARLDLIASHAEGFVYAISRTGVTGVSKVTGGAPAEVTNLVERIKARTKLPVCVGFGVSTAEDVRRICSVADGVVIGSSLVDWLHANWRHGAGRAALVELVRGWKTATR